jgi:hypothetical protein
MRGKRVVSAVAVIAIGAVGAAGGASAHSPVATISKRCSAAALAYGDKNAWTPGGLKCLGPGEFCSHKRGYAAAYKHAGFKCKHNGHLAYR